MPDPLDYAPPDPPTESALDVLLKALVIVGVVMVLLGSIMLDGGRILFISCVGFGVVLTVLGAVATATGTSPLRKIRLIALAAGIGLLCMAVLRFV